MPFELEIAQILYKLIRKDNWSNRYDRLEHFKRFQNLDIIIKELSKRGWIIIHHKSQYTGIALNTQFKKEIIKLIEANLPNLKGTII